MATNTDPSVELQNKWYNTLVAGLNLDSNSFQIFQGQRPLGNTSDELWTLFDAVPPKSLTQTQVISGHNSFFSDYQSIILTIIAQGGDQFETVMGDDLAAWEVYRKSLKPGDLPKGGIPEAFKAWAQINLSAVKASKGYAILRQLANGIVPMAVDAVLDENNLFNDGPTYSPKIDDFKNAITHGRPYNISFDSSTASSDVSHTWAKGEIEGQYKFFGGEAGASWNQLNKKACSEQVIIEASFQNLAVASIDPGKWYHSSAMGLAYQNAGNTVWPAGQSPTWDDMFSDEGMLQRATIEVVGFDGLELTMTSSASYSTSEQSQIKASAKVSYWPFFAASGEGGHTTSVIFDSSGKMTVKSNVPKGNPAVLGVNVLPIGAIIGGQLAEMPLLPMALANHQLRQAQQVSV